MTAEAQVTCYTVTVSAPQWVAEVIVKVDGKTVASQSHEVADSGPWWEFTVPVYLDGAHTVEVFDRAANADTPSLAFTNTETRVCEATTTSAPATAAPTTVPQTAAPTTVGSSTLPPATAPATTVQPSVSSAVEVAPPSTLPPQVSAAAVSTLPATGAAVDGYVGAGAGLLVVGAVLLAITRRRVAFGRRGR